MPACRFLGSMAKQNVMEYKTMDVSNHKVAVVTGAGLKRDFLV